MWGDLRLRAISIATAFLATGVVAGLLGPGPIQAQAAGFDPNAAEQQLFTLINQDRAQNGLAPLLQNPTLFSIARSAPHQVCGGGVTLHGRAQDMIERSYFSHQIPSCNSYVWPILDSYGVQYSSAGENIGWNTDSPQSTSTDSMNTAFMNSAGHRANILGNYNQVGVGAWAATGPWSDGSGGPYTGVIMYVEVFVNGPLPAPVSPTNVIATPGNGSATVSWTPPAPAGVTGYTVTPYTNGGATAGSSVTFGAGSSSVLISGLINGTSYSFRVTATNAAGAGPQSAASNTVTPSAAAPYSAVSTAQYQLTNSDGRTWTDIDTSNLALSVTPAADSYAIIGGNADLWTASAGFNQDLGINVNGNIAAWKESGGFAGTFSPNAAFVQTVTPMTAGTSYTVKLQWKTNKPAPGATIVAGAGPAAPYSPTRLTVQLVPKSNGAIASAVSTQQYALANSNGSTYTDLDPTTLSLSYTPTSSGTALLTANADLWTVNAGFNQDLGISVNGALAGWKESGGFAGTFSPNAAFAQVAYPMTAGVTYGVKLQWKTNKPGNGATILAGAGTGLPFSPTRLTLRFFPSGIGLLDRVSTAQYRMTGSDGVTWTDLDPGNLALSVTPSAACVAVLRANADLFTGNAGVNQDLGIDVNGVVVAWKESGGFAGTFSPNAAFIETAVALPAATVSTIKLRWKSNLPASAATIYAAAGPTAPFSPTRLTAEFIGC